MSNPKIVYSATGYGIVSVNGTAVTWISGQQFLVGWAGATIQIHGVNYTVSVVNSGISLTLTGSAGVQTNVSYYVTPVSFTFVLPGTNVPHSMQQSEGTKSYSTAGVRQLILKRLDNYLEFDVKAYLAQNDVQNWDTFMTQALSGASFDYYADSSLAAFTTYWLEDTSYASAYKHVGAYAFKVKFRQVIV